MINEQLEKLEKRINSKLSTKIINSEIKFDELLIEIKQEELISVLQFLKTDEN